MTPGRLEFSNLELAGLGDVVQHDTASAAELEEVDPAQSRPGYLDPDPNTLSYLDPDPQQGSSLRHILAPTLSTMGNLSGVCDLRCDTKVVVSSLDQNCRVDFLPTTAQESLEVAPEVRQAASVV